jgi:hypothetical protein
MFHWFRKRPKFYPGIITFERLEERIVLDGNVDASAQNNNADTQNVTAQNDPGASQAGSEQAAAAAAAPDSAAATAATAANPLAQIFDQPLNEVLVSNIPGEIEGISPNADGGSAESDSSQQFSIVLISNLLDNADALAAAAQDDATVIWYDAASANIGSINALLTDLVSSTGMQIDHLAILSHGSSGVLRLGPDEFWTVSTIEQDPTQWSVLGSLLDTDARIDLYGCSIGAGEQGRLFVDTLATITAATVWASDDLTGNVDGADWIFEVKSADDSGAFLIDVSQLASTPILLGRWDGTDGDDVHWNRAGDLFPDNWIDGKDGDDILGNEIALEYDEYNRDRWGYIWGGDGNDTIYNQGPNAYVNYYIDGGVDHDTIYNRDGAEVGGSIFGNSGNDTIINDDATVGDWIRGGWGDDNIYNQGSAYVGGDITGDGGNDYIYNSGSVHYDIRGDDGNDHIHNYGEVHGDLSGGPGDDYLYNDYAGVVWGNIFCGGGVDTVYNYGMVHTDMWANGDCYNYGDVLGQVKGNPGDDLIVFEGGSAGAMYADEYWRNAFGIWVGDGSDTIIIKAGSNVRGIDSGSDYAAGDTVILQGGTPRASRETTSTVASGTTLFVHLTGMTR